MLETTYCPSCGKEFDDNFEIKFIENNGYCSYCEHSAVDDGKKEN